jgi:3-isopropylmalate/(R)-2-methylmalate dehydratase large subunit
VATVGGVLVKFGVNELVSPEKVMFVTDHEPLAVIPEASRRQRRVRDYAKKYRVGHFFDVGRGEQGHIFPVEMGFVHPGMYVAAYDTHVPNYGAIGALGIPFLGDLPNGKPWSGWRKFKRSREGS